MRLYNAEVATNYPLVYWFREARHLRHPDLVSSGSLSLPRPSSFLQGLIVSNAPMRFAVAGDVIQPIATG
jgi:hypothetical protein